MGDSARLFIGMTVPDEAKTAVADAMRSYSDSITKEVPQKNWHVTLAFLGQVENFRDHLSALMKPLPQAFVPAASITHLGEGKHEGHLWAYVNPTQQISTLHQDVMKRVAEVGIVVPDDVMIQQFVPHVHLASIKKGKFGVQDTPALVTFGFAELQVYQSHKNDTTDDGNFYSVEGTIILG